MNIRRPTTYMQKVIKLNSEKEIKKSIILNNLKTQVSN